jgi:hypothetical protein
LRYGQEASESLRVHYKDTAPLFVASKACSADQNTSTTFLHTLGQKQSLDVSTKAKAIH